MLLNLVYGKWKKDKYVISNNCISCLSIAMWQKQTTSYIGKLPTVTEIVQLDY